MTVQKDSKTTIILHDTGDVVLLIIGEEKLSVAASRTALILLSPVFKAMLTGSFREATTTTSEIPLPDDNPAALLFLLRIAHLKFKDLPDTLSFRDLYHLSVVCDKYDAVGSVRPLWDRYGAPYLRYVGEADYEEWLYIAWTFGIGDVYMKVMSKLVMETAIIDGNLSHAGRHLEPILPLYAVEHIIETRSALIEGLIALTNDQFDNLCIRKEQHTAKESRCRRYKLGRMTDRLITYVSFMPKASSAPDFDKTTIERLCKHLNRAVLGECGDVEGGCGRTECGEERQNFKESIEKLVRSMSVLPEKIVTHIKTQENK